MMSLSSLHDQFLVNSLIRGTDRSNTERAKVSDLNFSNSNSCLELSNEEILKAVE
jgi:hypothetical protein